MLAGDTGSVRSGPVREHLELGDLGERDTQQQEDWTHSDDPSQNEKTMMQDNLE